MTAATPAARCQQDELYRAEQTLTDMGPTFDSIAGLEVWLHDAMLDRDWWHERFPKVKGIRVAKASRRDGSVGAWFDDDWSGQIEMSPDHWCGLYVCHEVAHVVAKAHCATQAHGPDFARTYLELTYRALGSETYVALHEAFKAGSIEVG